VALVLVGKEGVYLERRGDGLLGGLWGFPMAEGPEALPALLSRFGLTEAAFLGTVRHTFSHRRLTVRVFLAPWNGPVEAPKERPLSTLDRKIFVLTQVQAVEELSPTEH